MATSLDASSAESLSASTDTLVTDLEAALTGIRNAPVTTFEDAVSKYAALARAVSYTLGQMEP